MTQRQHKKEACAIVTRLIENYLDVGAHQTNTTDDENADKQERAMQELRREMDRRS